MLELLVLKTLIQRTSRRVKRTSGARDTITLTLRVLQCRGQMTMPYFRILSFSNLDVILGSVGVRTYDVLMK